MKKKPHPALEVEFTIQPHDDGTATVTARVLRQEVRRRFDGESILFGSGRGYGVSSTTCLEVSVKTLYLHGNSDADEESASRVFTTLSEAKKAVAAWTKIIKAYKPSKPSKTPKPPKPIVTVARSGGVA